MIPVKILIPFLLLAAMLSCKGKQKHDKIIDTRLGEIHLPNQEAENDFNKGLYYVRQKEYSTAKDFFLRADKESPNTPIILNAIGNCLNENGNPLQSLTYFKKALQIDSSFMRTYVNYGCSLNSCDSFDEAESIFRLGLRKMLKPSFERTVLYMNLANAYCHRSENDKALSLLDSAKMGMATDGQLYKTIMEFEQKIKRTTYLPPTR